MPILFGRWEPFKIGELIVFPDDHPNKWHRGKSFSVTRIYPNGKTCAGTFCGDYITADLDPEAIKKHEEELAKNVRSSEVKHTKEWSKEDMASAKPVPMPQPKAKDEKK